MGQHMAQCLRLLPFFTFISLLSAAFACECVRGRGLTEAGKQVGERS